MFISRLWYEQWNSKLRYETPYLFPQGDSTNGCYSSAIDVFCLGIFSQWLHTTITPVVNAPFLSAAAPKICEVTLNSCLVEWAACKPMGQDTIVYVLQLQSRNQEYTQVPMHLPHVSSRVCGTDANVLFPTTLPLGIVQFIMSLLLHVITHCSCIFSKWNWDVILAITYTKYVVTRHIFSFN